MERGSELSKEQLVIKTSGTGEIAGDLLLLLGFLITAFGIVRGLLEAYNGPSGMEIDIMVGIWATIALLGLLIIGFGTVINLLREINHSSLNR
jgi:uncharacterized membrane protein